MTSTLVQKATIVPSKWMVSKWPEIIKMINQIAAKMKPVTHLVANEKKRS